LPLYCLCNNIIHLKVIEFALIDGWGNVLTVVIVSSAVKKHLSHFMPLKLPWKYFVVLLVLVFQAIISFGQTCTN
jgi:hypothetical protein